MSKITLEKFGEYPTDIPEKFSPAPPGWVIEYRSEDEWFKSPGHYPHKIPGQMINWQHIVGFDWDGRPVIWSEGRDEMVRASNGHIQAYNVDYHKVTNQRPY